MTLDYVKTNINVLSNKKFLNARIYNEEWFCFLMKKFLYCFASSSKAFGLKPKKPALKSWFIFNLNQDYSHSIVAGGLLEIS